MGFEAGTRRGALFHPDAGHESPSFLMNPLDAQSPLQQEQVRKRREEAARQQQIQFKQQALKIAQQRQMAARKGNAATSPRSAQAGPELAMTVVKKAPERTPARTAVAAAVVAPAPVPTRAQVAAAALPPKPIPVAPVPELDRAEMRAELADFTSESKMEEAAAPPVVEEIPEVEQNAPDAEPLGLRMRTELVAIASAGEVEEPAAPRADLPPKPGTMASGDQLPALKLTKSSDLACPKCGSLIPEAQRGAHYTECRRCGEILKMD
jgi:hypothetical protein